MIEWITLWIIKEIPNFVFLGKNHFNIFGIDNESFFLQFIQCFVRNSVAFKIQRVISRMCQNALCGFFVDSNSAKSERRDELQHIEKEGLVDEL